MDQNYSKAYVEVLEVLKYFFQDELNQLPEDEIKFYEDNSDKNYKFDILPDAAIEDINISREASAVLLNLFVKFLALDEEKTELRTILEENERRAKLEGGQGYIDKSVSGKNSNLQTSIESGITENTSTVTVTHEIMPAEKESVFKRILNFIKKNFNK